MPRRLPPLNALRAFEAAGRHQSFSKAAEELGVSHSAVSRHVRGLELRLGVQLFRDLPRGVELTVAGAGYLAEVTPALDQIAEASDVFARQPEGQIIVDAEPLFASKWLIPRLASFYEAYPKIDLRLEARRELTDVTRYEADIAIRFFKAGSPDPDNPLISNAPLYPFAARALIGATRIDPEEILEFPLLQDRGGRIWQDWLRAAGLDPELIPEPTWRMRATLAIEAAIAGHGVILLSEEIAGQAVSSGQLIRASDIGFRQGCYRIMLGTEARRRAPVRHFRDWLLAESAGLRVDTQPIG